VGGILARPKALGSGRLDNVGAWATIGTLAVEARVHGAQYLGARFPVWGVEETMLHMNGGHSLDADHLAGPHGRRHDGNHGPRLWTAHVLVHEGHRFQRQKFGKTVLGYEVAAPI